MLANIISLVSGCVTFLGGFLVVWGAVSLGLAIREQQGGSQIASAISTIAGSTCSSSSAEERRKRHPLVRLATGISPPSSSCSQHA